VLEKTTTRKKVFVNVTSVTGTEWFEGGRNGLNPQFRFIMFSHDYNNEKVIEYNGTQYTIYRTFLRSTDEIELYAELRKGNE
jgi:SPP1 family predicted phage head-tail adaptor